MEPISPELCLVCPELRERALAEPPDFVWNPLPSFVSAPVLERPGVPPAERASARRVAVWVFRLVGPAAAAAAFATVLVLVLTLVADALR